MATFQSHIPAGEQEVKNWKSQLYNLLLQLDVPKLRLNLNEGDIAWLSRNLRIRNAHHPACKDAIKIIIRLLKAGVR